MEIKKEIPLIVTFELGSTKKSIRELLNISKSTTYRLENSTKDIVDINIDKQRIGRGIIHVKGGKKFVEIIELNGEVTTI